jgi:septum site-determining protein MinC
MAGNLVQGAVFTVMVVRAGLLRDADFEAELSEQIRRSPRFFLNAPVVLDLKDMGGFTTTDEFTEARDTLRRHTLALVGVQNALPAQVEAAAAAELASFAPNSTGPRRPRAAAASAPDPAPATSPSPPPAPSTPLPERGAAKTRLITQPVRSGTQIYARGADLVVTAAVHAGAEIIADGNIHVYGPLHGRAMAGAAGERDARIFCSRFEAELVSIAGRYLVSEQMPPEMRGLAVQIVLDDERLTITRN